MSRGLRVGRYDAGTAGIWSLAGRGCSVEKAFPGAGRPEPGSQRRRGGIKDTFEGVDRPLRRLQEECANWKRFAPRWTFEVLAQEKGG